MQKKLLIILNVKMLNIINDLYLKTDVLLIVDVYDSYRKD